MSRQGTKKVAKKVERPGLSTEEVDEIKQAFDLFDTNGTGKIDPKELKAAMQSLGFDSKNPTIFQLIADLDTPEAAKNGGIDFDNFVEAINNKLIFYIQNVKTRNKESRKEGRTTRPFH